MKPLVIILTTTSNISVSLCHSNPSLLHRISGAKAVKTLKEQGLYQDITSIFRVIRDQDILGKVRSCIASLNLNQSPLQLGTDGHTKTNEFSEKFQTAFDPPPHFRKIILRILRQNCDKSAYIHFFKFLMHIFIQCFLFHVE